MFLSRQLSRKTCNGFRKLQWPWQSLRCASITRLRIPLRQTPQQYEEDGKLFIQQKLGVIHTQGRSLHNASTDDFSASEIQTSQLRIIRSAQRPVRRCNIISRAGNEIRRLRTPSEVLHRALRRAGYTHSLPAKFAWKLNHAYVSPISAQRRPLTQKYVVMRFSNPPLRLKLELILARYIEFARPYVNIDGHDKYDQKIAQVFDEQALELLRLKGYNIQDVESWAWIITTQSSEQAAVRLLQLCNANLGRSSMSHNLQESKYPVDPVPFFIFSFILRRKNISPRALQMLILHAWHRLHNWRDSRLARTISAPGKLEVITSPRIWLKKATKASNNPMPRANLYRKLTETTITVMVIRLLRHARAVWPPAIISITAMLTGYLGGHNDDIDGPQARAVDAKTSARLSFVYNKILALIAAPSSLYPMRSIQYHQRAQFNLLKRMDGFNPPLLINKEGYHAVITVQLAHRKTMHEREWADMKAESWPPWKIDRLGLDVEKGVELGISRAREFLIRTNEAGYASQAWEASANILSGWDTDRSPTIQTRSTFLSSKRDREVQNPVNNLEKSDLAGRIWASRIRAARTLDESWACFLAYKHQQIPASENVYHEMFEKIIFDGNRRDKEATRVGSDVLGLQSTISTDMPGDSKEVAKPPSDPRDRIYVQTPAPNTDSFLETMIKDKVRPSGTFLSLLLRNATSRRHGLEFLRVSALSRRTVDMLVRTNIPTEQEARSILAALPKNILASYISFWCRHGRPSTCRKAEPCVTRGLDLKGPFSAKDPLSYAYQLLQICRPCDRSPWYSLLSALRERAFRSSTDPIAEPRAVNDIWIWGPVIDTLDSMNEIGIRLDFAGLTIVCKCLEKAVLDSQRTLARIKGEIGSARSGSESGIPIERIQSCQPRAEQVLEEAPKKVKAIFQSLVAPQFINTKPREHSYDGYLSWLDLSKHSSIDPNLLLPQLLEVPAPAHLHAIIRVLGLSQDFQSIQDLIIWMAQFEPELKVVRDELQNGSKMMRRTLIACRVFLERRWVLYESFGEAEDNIANTWFPEETLNKVHEVVIGVQDWGGWPTDAEIEDYCGRGWTKQVSIFSPRRQPNVEN